MPSLNFPKEKDHGQDSGRSRPPPSGLPMNTCPCSKGEPPSYLWGFLCDSKPSWDSSLDRGAAAQCIRIVKTQRNKCHRDPAEPQIHRASRTPSCLVQTGGSVRQQSVLEGPGCPGSEDVCFESCPQEASPLPPYTQSQSQPGPACSTLSPSSPLQSPGSSNLRVTTPVRRRSYLQNKSVSAGPLIT